MSDNERERDTTGYSDAQREGRAADDWDAYGEMVNDLFALSGEQRIRTMPYLALGLTGESGEVAEHIKKWLAHGLPLDLDKLVLELGDVLWYLQAMAAECGVSLAEVRDRNVTKLRARYPQGFVAGGGNR